jgi:hypothetical protein
MRCLQCNAEMTLIGAVPADATLPGFEHHTFSCSACNEIERRLLFTGTKSLPSSSTWVRAVEKLVSKQKALKEEQALAKKSSHQSRSPSAADGLRIHAPRHQQTSRWNRHQHSSGAGGGEERAA